MTESSFLDKEGRPTPALSRIYRRLIGRLLRLFFRLLYGRFAWAYDLVAASVSLGLWRDWVQTASAYLPGPRVLEIGHGPGHLLAHLQIVGIEALGLDASRQMGLLAYRLLRRVGRPLLINGYAQSLPFPGKCFDQVVATFPSEFAWEASAIAEVHRVLVPGGQWILVPVAWITGSRPLERAAATLFRLTGQAPDSLTDKQIAHFKERFFQAGFQMRVRSQPLKSSMVLVIQLEKEP